MPHVYSLRRNFGRQGIGARRYLQSPTSALTWRASSDRPKFPPWTDWRSSRRSVCGGQASFFPLAALQLAPVRSTSNVLGSTWVLACGEFCCHATLHTSTLLLDTGDPTTCLDSDQCGLCLWGFLMHPKLDLLIEHEKWWKVHKSKCFSY